MQSTEPESWAPVVGYEGFYEVSNLGRVRSVEKRVRTARGTRLRPSVVRKLSANPRGYLTVNLSRGEAGSRTQHVHTLVLSAFVGPRPEGMEARHLDGNPANNSIANLAWGTHSENNLDRVRHGTHHLASRTHCPRGHEYTPENTCLDQGKRSCRECRRAAGRRRALRKKLAEEIMRHAEEIGD